MTTESVRRDLEATLERLRSEDPTLQCEIELPPKPERGIDRVAMLPTDTSTDSYVVKSIVRNHKKIVGKDMDNVGVVFPLSYAGNDTSHLWQAGIPCCLYGPSGQFFPEQYVLVEEIMTCTRVLALTALDLCVKS
jgi:acetylornithine deacetylase